MCYRLINCTLFVNSSVSSYLSPFLVLVAEKFEASLLRELMTPNIRLFLGAVTLELEINNETS